MRYGIFSVTGFDTPVEGGSWEPHPRWYVTDDAFCGEIVFVSEFEHEAQNERFRLNADERRWEKEQERALRDA